MKKLQEEAKKLSESWNSEKNRILESAQKSQEDRVASIPRPSVDPNAERTQELEDALRRAVEEAKAEVSGGGAKCPRVEDVKAWMHGRGVNLRYLGAILNACKAGGRGGGKWSFVLAVELAARSFKRVVDDKLREGGAWGPKIAAVLNACLCGKEEDENDRDAR